MLREGDRVMQIRNNYDILWRRDDGQLGTGTFNGDTGSVLMVDRASELITVRLTTERLNILSGSLMSWNMRLPSRLIRLRAANMKR